MEVALSQTGTRPVFNETLTGTTDADVIYGFQGNDAINGGDGGDWLFGGEDNDCLLYTSPSPRDRTRSRMPSSA